MVLQNTGRFKPDKVSSESADYNGKEDGVDRRLEKIKERQRIDERYGFLPYKESKARVGWLINMHATEIVDDNKKLFSAVDYYFIEEDGDRFKVSLPFKPYFYLSVKKGTHRAVSTFLMKKYQTKIAGLEVISKEDLDLQNHLTGIQHMLLKLSFNTTDDLQKVKKEIVPVIKKNKQQTASHMYSDILDSDDIQSNSSTGRMADQLDSIVDIREHDVPFHCRVSIDLKINIGHWYDVIGHGTEPPTITLREDLVHRPEPVIMAYDIETTKLPLKFPDSTTDQIMMISYMINAQGYLIINREIVSADIEDFEYTPKPEFEGPFIIFNEADELSTIKRFFDHILDVKHNIFVTYNGDMFDWPFVEARASYHGMNMENEIGFAKDNQGEYKSRPAVHMDCFRWVKRDSYLPVGSQNLKAVTKAKLRYDPVELDPEDMCRLASEEPEVLANYSVSDAVATYYLYMKYVHPFVFALCTIIPLDPDEVLRKGSGTLCEALLMVQAFHANIIFPNKQEAELNKMTSDGHILDSETYVGGHVEALECGVFRADIPCRFRMVPEAFQNLKNNARRTLQYAIEVEEKIPMENVLNFDEIASDVEEKLIMLRDCPNRLEKPIIYHLDVAAMYPNIILTNRLQPPAIVEEHTCAACDFNKPGALCQRHLTWSWRGDYLPATKGEYLHIQSQLEREKFPPQFPGGPNRAFHQLSKEEQATWEKKRLTEYCRKAYKKTKVTKIEERVSTVCQRENSFYVDTVRAFRDRRYTFKGLVKTWKGKLSEAEKKKDAAAIKQANGMIVLYDSLQLAHKCILNSFYGYVMRKGARWYSMEMAGIVCYTGASIITQAREIVEQIGRPLELDTDGIWCILPATFPENYVVKTNNPKKPKVTISYPGAMLNVMVKDSFTNDQYHEFVDPETLKYEVRQENSIFFEVDGPYLAMILPASKEEGKKLKKRYAVFNFDGSLAELKGFEVKRRGELQLIKIFQSSVFNAFLKGTTLDECYNEVAKVANYWLDILYSKGNNLPDFELFDLISENRSMSRKLEEYEGQKSTSIKTAQRLAEFLGDQMVQNAGLSCQFIIAKRPMGAPVTERAIPLAIFQSDEKTKRHYLKKWLKDHSMTEFDIRDILDWSYYVERLGSTVQKIITIPAALQSVENPVQRCPHPAWLQKKLSEKNDKYKQKKISMMFDPAPKPVESITSQSSLMTDTATPVDIEDIVPTTSRTNIGLPITTKRKRTTDNESNNLDRSWREVLGPPPPRGTNKAEMQVWLAYHKRKWEYQRQQQSASNKRMRLDGGAVEGGAVGTAARAGVSKGLGGFLRQKARSMYDSVWQVVQIAPTRDAGVYRLWAVIGNDLHVVKLHVPRIFYVNRLTENPVQGTACKRVSRILPRNHPVFYLYEYSIPEHIYQSQSNELYTDFSSSEIEGVYELQVPLEFRALLRIGCVCKVNREFIKAIGGKETDTFELDNLDFQALSQHSYLEPGKLKTLYLYHHVSGTKHMFGLFNMSQKKATIFVLDSVKTNQMPNVSAVYNSEHNAKLSEVEDEAMVPGAGHTFDIRIENQSNTVHKGLNKLLQTYQAERKGPTCIAVQSNMGMAHLVAAIPTLEEFPVVTLQSTDSESLYSVLDWQRVGARRMIQRYLNIVLNLQAMTEQCRYLHIPVGNLPADTTLFGCDLFYARHLIKHNHLLWCSYSDRADLGGREADDHRFQGESLDEGQCSEMNRAGCYDSICVELDIAAMPINALTQSSHINDSDPTNSTISFDMVQQTTLEDMLKGQGIATMLSHYDETALCANAFRIMKMMVTSWVRDVHDFQNVYADNQIVNFYRWIRSPSSLLYDSALRKSLNNLLKKLFTQMIYELRQLGVSIVFANFNRLVICTKKRDIADALLYVEYIGNKIRSKQRFHFIELNYQDCWKFLLWMNSTNYGGIQGKVPLENNNSDENTQGETDEEESKPELVMRWNIMNYLPETASCRMNFGKIVGGYIMTLYQHLVEQYGDRAQGMTPVRKKINTSQPTQLQDDDAPVNFAKTVITDMCHSLFRVTQRVQKKLSLTHHNQIDFHDEFPDLPGSHLNPKNPALELVKYVCQVLSLDSTVSGEVIKMKRDLLQLINVREFSDEAQFLDPCMSYILPEVICLSCNYIRDLDLCRDSYKSNASERTVWFCPMCKDPYDSDEIEYALIDAVNRKSMSYTLQDVECMKCNGVKRSNLSQYCECAGNFTNTIFYMKQLKPKLLTFRSIARHFRMELLLENVHWMISMNPDTVE